MNEEIRVGGGRGCRACFRHYGEHTPDCPIGKKLREEEAERRNRPRRCRWPLDGVRHPNGSDAAYRYGCYFPLTDLFVHDMGGRGTGVPRDAAIEWLD